MVKRSINTLLIESSGQSFSKFSKRWRLDRQKPDHEFQLMNYHDILFSVYAEMMIIEVMEDVEKGVRVGGELLKDVKFADDQVMVSQMENGLQTIMDSLSKTGKMYDIKINLKKTKVIRVCRSESNEKMKI